MRWTRAYRELDVSRKASREKVLTGVDLALLAAIDEEGNLVRACRRLQITRDRGVYRLLRLRNALGGPVVESARGGRSPGHTRLTARGSELMAQARGTIALDRSAGRGHSVLGSAIVHGTWTADPSPRVRLASGRSLFVGFEAPEGTAVTVAVDPEVVLVARRAFPTSARNTIPGVVRRVRTVDRHRSMIEADIGGWNLRAIVTPESLRSLRISVGSHVYLYLKASALRPVDVLAVPTKGRRSRADLRRPRRIATTKV